MTLNPPTRKVSIYGSWIQDATVANIKRAVATSGQGFGVNLHPDPNFYPSLGLIAHNGLDIPAPLETEILASHDGKVTYVQNDFKSGFGIVIQAQGYKTIYWHQQKNLVLVGQSVKAGDVIGLCNSTGLSTGNHLHFGLKLTDSNNNTINPGNGYDGAVDPMPFLQDYGTEEQMYRLVKVSKDVYRIKNGKKDLFLNANSFTEIDGRWSAIEQISQTELDAIPDGNVLVAVSQE